MLKKLNMEKMVHFSDGWFLEINLNKLVLYNLKGMVTLEKTKPEVLQYLKNNNLEDYNNIKGSYYGTTGFKVVFKKAS